MEYIDQKTNTILKRFSLSEGCFFLSVFYHSIAAIKSIIYSSELVFPVISVMNEPGTPCEITSQKPDDLFLSFNGFKIFSSPYLSHYFVLKEKKLYIYNHSEDFCENVLEVPEQFFLAFTECENECVVAFNNIFYVYQSESELILDLKTIAKTKTMKLQHKDYIFIFPSTVINTVAIQHGLIFIAHDNCFIQVRSVKSNCVVGGLDFSRYENFIISSICDVGLGNGILAVCSVSCQHLIYISNDGMTINGDFYFGHLFKHENGPLKIETSYHRLFIYDKKDMFYTFLPDYRSKNAHSSTKRKFEPCPKLRTIEFYSEPKKEKLLEFFVLFINKIIGDNNSTIHKSQHLFKIVVQSKDKWTSNDIDFVKKFPRVMIADSPLELSQDVFIKDNLVELTRFEKLVKNFIQKNQVNPLAFTFIPQEYFNANPESFLIVLSRNLPSSLNLTS
jgi:hypothetical protein